MGGGGVCGVEKMETSPNFIVEHGLTELTSSPEDEDNDGLRDGGQTHWAGVGHGLERDCQSGGGAAQCHLSRE